MATWYAVASGDVDASIWSSTPGGGASVQHPFTNADQLVSNGQTVNLNVSTTALEIRNSVIGGSTTGGHFRFTANCTLTANVHTPVTTPLLQWVASSLTCNVVGNITGGATTFDAFSITGASATLVVTGDITGGSATSVGLITSSATTSANITINGNLLAAVDDAVQIDGDNSTVTVNGNITGASSSVGLYSTAASTAINVNNGTITGGSSTTNGGIYLHSTATFNTITCTNCVISAGAGSASIGIYINSADSTLTVTGTSSITGGSAFSTGAAAISITQTNTSTRTLTITGNVTSSTSAGDGILIGATTLLNVNITGNVTGNGGGAGLASALVSGIITINGNVSGGVVGGVGVEHSGAATLVVNGTATGGDAATTQGIVITGTGAGEITVTRAKGGDTLVGSVGVDCISTRICNVREFEFGTLGASPTLGPIRLTDATSNVYICHRFGTSHKTLVVASTVVSAAPSNVRLGVSYDNASQTGTMAVPGAASVLVGVPIDATTGTATFTSADFWGAAISGLTVSGSIGERLKNAATVTTTGQQLSDALNGL